MAYTKYSLTPANNTAAPPDGAPEGMLPSAVNDTMRDMMAQIRDCGDGIRDGTYTMTAPKITGGTITGSTINNSAIGGTTAAAGKFTTLEATGATTFSGATVVSASLTANTFSSSGATITGGTINSTAIGGTTAAAGKFTTLEATGVATFSAGAVGTPAITTTGDTNTGIFFPAADTIAFTEGGTESMRISSGGEVGIGSTATTYKLNIQNASASAFDGMQVAGDNASYNLVFQSGSVSASGTLFGVNKARGQFISSNNSPIVIGTLDAFPLVFGTNATERMRIDSSGKLLVGTTAAISSGFTTISYVGTALNGLIISESANTSDTSFLGFNNGATNIGSVSRVGATSAVIYSTTSDERLKSNIADANPVLDKLMDVKVRQFDWTEGNLHQDAGFIAQELAPVLSGIVTEGKTEEDMWQLDYSRLTPYLVKAIQEQQTLITNLTTRLNALEGK